MASDRAYKAPKWSVHPSLHPTQGEATTQEKIGRLHNFYATGAACKTSDPKFVAGCAHLAKELQVYKDAWSEVMHRDFETGEEKRPRGVLDPVFVDRMRVSIGGLKGLGIHGLKPFEQTDTWQRAQKGYDAIKSMMEAKEARELNDAYLARQARLAQLSAQRKTEEARRRTYNER